MVRKGEIKVLEVPTDSDGSCKLQRNECERVAEQGLIRAEYPRIQGQLHEQRSRQGLHIEDPLLPGWRKGRLKLELKKRLSPF